MDKKYDEILKSMENIVKYVDTNMTKLCFKIIESEEVKDYNLFYYLIDRYEIDYSGISSNMTFNLFCFNREKFRDKIINVLKDKNDIKNLIEVLNHLSHSETYKAFNCQFYEDYNEFDNEFQIPVLIEKLFFAKMVEYNFPKFSEEKIIEIIFDKFKCLLDYFSLSQIIDYTVKFDFSENEQYRILIHLIKYKLKFINRENADIEELKNLINTINFFKSGKSLEGNYKTPFLDKQMLRNDFNELYNYIMNNLDKKIIVELFL